MTTVSEIAKVLEEFAPLQLQESYDNSGLIIGSKDQKIHKILICLDSTEEVIEEAIQKNCQLIIAHHPLIFGGLTKINDEHYVEKAVRKAIKNDISIYACHTNADNVYEGVNKKISEKLELKNIQILKPAGSDEKIGAGMIGELNKNLLSVEILDYITEKMQLKNFRYTEIPQKIIKRIAICGGSGSFLIKDAIKAKADAFISADIKYHEFFEANEDMCIIDIGHYESERFTIELFSQVLSAKFPNIALQFSEVNTNPVKYFK